MEKVDIRFGSDDQAMENRQVNGARGKYSNAYGVINQDLNSYYLIIRSTEMVMQKTITIFRLRLRFLKGPA